MRRQKVRYLSATPGGQAGETTATAGCLMSMCCVAWPRTSGAS